MYLWIVLIVGPGLPAYLPAFQDLLTSQEFQRFFTVCLVAHALTGPCNPEHLFTESSGALERRRNKTTGGREREGKTILSEWLLWVAGEKWGPHQNGLAFGQWHQIFFKLEWMQYWCLLWVGKPNLSPFPHEVVQEVCV